MKQIAKMSAEELAALTREDLIARIRELEPPPPNDWHSWMDALLHIVLHPYPVQIEREFVLGNQPPRADFIILMEEEVVDLGLRVFKIFREQNIIEFKGPDDELNESVLWKCIGYAGFYIHVREIPASQVTLTLIRSTKPVGLLQDLAAYVVPDDASGIYHIKNWKVDLPIQLVVTSELAGPEYAGFRSISKKPRLQDITQMFHNHEQETNPELIDFYRAYWNISARLTGNVLEEAKRRYPEMERTILDIFKPEIDKKINLAVKEAVNLAVKESVSHHLYEYVQDGGMALDWAAKKAGMSPASFIASMKEAGYTVPQMA